MTRLSILMIAVPALLLPSLSATAACSTTEPLGRLTQNAPGGMLEYSSSDGIANIKVDEHTITVTVMEEFTVQHWGDPHENLSGKHIKDWDGDRRTLLLQNGVKITMHAAGPHDLVETMTIYEGSQRHQISNVGNVIMQSCDEDADTTRIEAEEADGETAHMAVLPRAALSANTMYYQNVYTEVAGEGGVMERTFAPVPLGEAFDAFITELGTTVRQVNDYYDDQRLGHT